MRNIRVIPRLDVKGSNIVKGVHMEGLRVLGRPFDLAKKYYEDGADEIIYMDIVASLYQRSLDFALLKSVCENIFIPFTVSGGIRSINDINNVLRAGADKVAINTYAVNNPGFIYDAVKKFGSQCIVISVEAKKIRERKWEVYTDGGREKTGVDVIAWVKKAIDCGAGELLISSIDQDGTRKGYDADLIECISSFSPIPVIAHGGAGSMDTVLEAIVRGGINAVCASSVFHYGDYTIKELKEYLFNNNIEVRT